MEGILGLIFEGVSAWPKPAPEQVSWVFTSQDLIIVTNSSLGVERYNDTALPSSLRKEGYFHIGDISVVDGKILAPIENEDKSAHRAVIGIWDATTLRMVGPIGKTTQLHMPWLAYRASKKLLYSSEFDNVTELLVYDMDLNEVDRVALDQTLPEGVQGGTFMGDTLFVSTNANDSVVEINPDTGAVGAIARQNRGAEMEGIAFFDFESTPVPACPTCCGQLHFFENGLEQQAALASSGKQLFHYQVVQSS